MDACKIVPKKKRVLSAGDVYSALKSIPEGKVTTYGDIARTLGMPNASRAVGRILNMNPNPVTVPCHRVIMSSGQLGGYAYGKQRKKELLEKEGVVFEGDKVTEFKNRRVCPRIPG